jgi:hypothetical protein
VWTFRAVRLDDLYGGPCAIHELRVVRDVRVDRAMKRSKRDQPTPANRPLTEAELTRVSGGTPVTFTYQKIESIWKEGNVGGTDDWEKHNV